MDWLSTKFENGFLFSLSQFSFEFMLLFFFSLFYVFFFVRPCNLLRPCCVPAINLQTTLLFPHHTQLSWQDKDSFIPPASNDCPPSLSLSPSSTKK